jgi:hypothetical protein
MSDALLRVERRFGLAVSDEGRRELNRLKDRWASLWDAQCFSVDHAALASMSDIETLWADVEAWRDMWES